MCIGLITLDQNNLAFKRWLLNHILHHDSQVRFTPNFGPAFALDCYAIGYQTAQIELENTEGLYKHADRTTNKWRMERRSIILPEHNGGWKRALSYCLNTFHNVRTDFPRYHVAFKLLVSDS